MHWNSVSIYLLAHITGGGEVGDYKEEPRPLMYEGDSCWDRRWG